MAWCRSRRSRDDGYESVGVELIDGAEPRPEVGVEIENRSRWLNMKENAVNESSDEKSTISGQTAFEISDADEDEDKCGIIGDSRGQVVY